jgi:hypothetical protein
MEYEGMVYALEQIHRLLRPAGTLIDIRPSPDAFPFVEVRSEDEQSFREDDPGFDYEDDLRHAERAVMTAVERGVFRLDQRRWFEMRTHPSSVRELRDHWDVYGAYDAEEKEATLARRQDAMYARAHEVLQRTSAAELVYVEAATMTRLVS